MKKASTPLNNVKNQHTPNSNEINRSLLTPCRRIGLTRSKNRGSIKKIEDTGKIYSTPPINKPVKNLVVSPAINISECSTPTAKTIETESIKRKIFFENKNFTNNNLTKPDFSTPLMNSPVNTNLKPCDISTIENNVVTTPNILNAKKTTQKRKLFLKEDSEKNLCEKTKIQCTPNNSEKSVLNANINIDLQNCTERDIICKIRVLEKSVSEKKVKLTDLKRASLYQKKHDLVELKLVMNKWRKGCQEALEQLRGYLNESKGYSCTMKGLISDLNIPHELVNYNIENDCFIDDI